jgi:hypothetical protein
MLIKVSKKKYLEDIINGRIYFNHAEYFRDVESDNSKDSREGKVAIDTNQPIDIKHDIINLVLSLKPEEVNMSYISSAKSPIFCCSLLENHMLLQTGQDTYNLSNEYIQEMGRWGNTVLIFSLKEFCSKIYQKCIAMGITPYMDKVKYDQNVKKLSFTDFKKTMKANKLEPFFHKTNRFINQNEFRIVLDLNGRVSDSNHFILEIERLDFAQIFELESLSDLGFKIITNNSK